MKAIYLDVRTPVEFAEGHYPGSINHDVELLTAGVLPDSSQIPKSTPIKVYCRSGARAGVAKKILERAGYVNVENVGGLESLMK